MEGGERDLWFHMRMHIRPCNSVRRDHAYTQGSASQASTGWARGSTMPSRRLEVPRAAPAAVVVARPRSSGGATRGFRTRRTSRTSRAARARGSSRARGRSRARPPRPTFSVCTPESSGRGARWRCSARKRGGAERWGRGEHEARGGRREGADLYPRSDNLIRVGGCEREKLACGGHDCVRCI